MASQNRSVSCNRPRVAELELCYAELVEQSREARALRGKLEEKVKSFTAVDNENRRLRLQLLQATSEIQRFKDEGQFLREEMKHMTETHRLALDRVKASRDEDAARNKKTMEEMKKFFDTNFDEGCDEKKDSTGSELFWRGAMPHTHTSVGTSNESLGALVAPEIHNIECDAFLGRCSERAKTSCA